MNKYRVYYELRGTYTFRDVVAETPERAQMQVQDLLTPDTTDFYFHRKPRLLERVTEYTYPGLGTMWWDGQFRFHDE